MYSIIHIIKPKPTSFNHFLSNCDCFCFFLMLFFLLQWVAWSIIFIVFILQVLLFLDWLRLTHVQCSDEFFACLFITIIFPYIIIIIYIVIEHIASPEVSVCYGIEIKRFNINEIRNCSIEFYVINNISNLDDIERKLSLQDAQIDAESRMKLSCCWWWEKRISKG